MESKVVLGIGEESRLKPCSSEIGSAKQHNSGEKTLGGDSTQENDFRVSEIGKQKLLDDNKAKENVAETENLTDSGVIEDSVMNGVTSLLKLKQDFSDKDKIDEDDEDEDGEDEEEHGYYVGDFVWGEIKDHQWWPGQIYDESDASDLALKINQKGKLLVAYFGDGTFAWCGSSQLKPFAESFKECSKLNNSSEFLGAVAEAVEELGKQIERLLICDCAEYNHKFVSSEAKNVGIKEGVLVRDVRRELISSLLVGKPEGILKDVKSFAKSVSFSGLLELEILKRKVSAFYRSKGEYGGLTEFHEPQSVPGLEDKNNDEDDDDDYEDENTDASKEEEVLDSEESLRKCSGFPDHRLQHRRKQKSIAEIMESESAARFQTELADGNVMSCRKKVKPGELETLSTITPKRRRMSKLSTGHKKVEESDREEIAKTEFSNMETDIDSTPLASLRKRVKIDASSAEISTGNGDTTTSKRKRKLSKYFSSDYLSDFSWKRMKKDKTESKVSSQRLVGETSGNLMEDDKMVKTSEPLSNNGSAGKAVEFLRLGATTMEINDLIRVAALGTEYPKDSNSRDLVREFMSIYRSFIFHDGANRKCSEKEKSKMQVEVGETTMEKSEKKTEGKSEKDEVAETTMEYVKKKLEEMKSLVDKSEGGISEEVKVKLEDEMVNLLEKVKKMKSF